jgi:hypothetical protein
MYRTKNRSWWNKGRFLVVNDPSRVDMLSILDVRKIKVTSCAKVSKAAMAARIGGVNKQTERKQSWIVGGRG